MRIKKLKSDLSVNQRFIPFEGVILNINLQNADADLHHSV